MTAIRNWRDAAPVVGHESAIIWRLFDERGTRDLPDDEAPLQGIQSLTMHRMQPGKSGDYHVHENREQVYYFTEGRGKMKIDDVVHDVQKGDAVCIPPMSWHQMINDTDDWLEHLIITAWVKEGYAGIGLSS